MARTDGSSSTTSRRVRVSMRAFCRAPRRRGSPGYTAATKQAARAWADTRRLHRRTRSRRRDNPTTHARPCDASPIPALPRLPAMPRRKPIRSGAARGPGPARWPGKRQAAPKTPEQESSHDHEHPPHRALRQGHRSVQARALGDRARCHPRPRLRLRQDLPAHRPVAGRRAGLPEPGRPAPAQPGAGPQLRLHLRPGRALHRRQGDAGGAGQGAGRPGGAGSAGAHDRRGAEAPGDVPPPGKR